MRQPDLFILIPISVSEEKNPHTVVLVDSHCTVIDLEVSWLVRPSDMPYYFPFVSLFTCC